MAWTAAKEKRLKEDLAEINMLYTHFMTIASWLLREARGAMKSRLLLAGRKPRAHGQRRR